MASNRSIKQKPTEEREHKQSGGTTRETSAQDPAGTPLGTDDEAARAAQQAAIEQTMARQNVRMARSPGAMGPLGRSVLLIAALTLAALVGVWALLAL
jgi:hypothetical protein